MYNFKEIEKKWQSKWEKDGLYKFNKENKDKKLYTLEMFSYPSGAALHMGHWYNFGPSDTWARIKRMQGYEVFHPMGFDAFGLPAENYAIKTGIHPKDSTEKNVATMERQIKEMGASYDWDYEVVTCREDYYKWTQWMFAKLYEQGLAYKKEAPVNFCPSCNTVLANEQVVQGKCERCDSEVQRKKLSQWFFKITDYAEELLTDLDKIDWPERTKILQRNWIGKSNGAKVKFKIDNTDYDFEVFTTRPDTLFGATYVVFAPEHDLVEKITTKEQKEAVEKYQEEASKISEIDRMSTVKEKTGVFTGSYAINPVNNEKIPIWIADYVLSTYGTGIVMAVPAHDERDWDFAKKFNLPIKTVVAEKYLDIKNPPREGKKDTKRKVAMAILKHWSEDKYAYQAYKTQPWNSLIMGGIEDGESPEEAMIREIREESGYQNIKKIEPISRKHFDSFFAAHKDVNRVSEHFDFYVELADGTFEEPTEEEKNTYDIIWVTKEELFEKVNIDAHLKTIEYYFSGGEPFTDYGIAVDSEFLNGLETVEAKEEMIKHLEKIKSGEETINYKLRDWLVSRQRYWGAPIPIVYCEDCGEVLVKEADLPVKLPYDVEFKNDGKSPLATSEEFVNTTCPKCGKPAKREVDTLDTFVCSSWYFLRYPDAQNDKEPFDKELINQMLPVDKYIGGIEHACMHLLYARFFTKALRDMGYLNFDEPFKSLVHQGMILGADGEKMSKSKGNSVAPEEYIKAYGSDVLRTYLMFGFNYIDGGPWSDEGIKAIARYYDRINKLIKYYKNNFGSVKTKELDLILNKTIKAVTEDSEKFQFNTAIARKMEYLNALNKEMQKETKLDQSYITTLIKLIAPFAPHLAEELWESLGNNESIFKEQWPKVDETKIIEDTYELVVQVNGKVRGKEEVNKDVSKEELEKIALDNENVKKFIEGKEVIKKIIIPNKLVNIVIK